VTLEFTVNERAKAPYTSTERRSYEQLIRRLLNYPGRPAVMVLHHYPWVGGQAGGQGGRRVDSCGGWPGLPLRGTLFGSGTPAVHHRLT